AYLGDDYVVKDRLMQQETSFRMINIEKWISFLLLIFILLIGMFNVVSALSVLIVEKKSAIQSLSNLGARRGMIVSVFAWQTIIIGVIGTFVGVILGVSASLAQQHFGFLKLSGDPNAMIVDAYPVLLQWGDVVAVAIMSVAVCVCAAFGVAFIAASRVKATR
ncbi:MAG: ABC transporter permease, partial [Muribaculaceae bacterium]|nr:ABC transporter permease [Muribaculaceae bacterium]